MANRRLTLRVTAATDVPGAVARLEAELARAVTLPPAVAGLILDTALRFQSELLALAVGAGDEPRNARSGVGETLLQGDGFSLCITTRAETRSERLLNWLLRRPAAFT